MNIRTSPPLINAICVSFSAIAMKRIANNSHPPRHFIYVPKMLTFFYDSVYEGSWLEFRFPLPSEITTIGDYETSLEQSFQKMQTTRTPSNKAK